MLPQRPIEPGPRCVLIGDSRPGRRSPTRATAIPARAPNPAPPPRSGRDRSALRRGGRHRDIDANLDPSLAIVFVEVEGQVVEQLVGDHDARPHPVAVARRATRPLQDAGPAAPRSPRPSRYAAQKSTRASQPAPIGPGPLCRPPLRPRRTPPDGRAHAMWCRAPERRRRRTAGPPRGS